VVELLPTHDADGNLLPPVCEVVFEDDGDTER
jgi:hypothetical protein